MSESLAFRVDSPMGEGAVRRWAEVLGLPEAHLGLRPGAFGGGCAVLEISQYHAGQGWHTRRLSAGLRAIAAGGSEADVRAAMREQGGAS